MPAFRLAVKLGATGLESDVWVTRDGVAVLDHDGGLGGRFRRRPIAQASIEEVPVEVPRLTEVLDLADSHHLALSLDVKDPAGFPVVRELLAGGSALAARTYLCCEDFAVLREVAPLYRDLQLVDSSRLAKMKDGPERRLAQVSDTDGVRMHARHLMTRPGEGRKRDSDRNHE